MRAYPTGWGYGYKGAVPLWVGEPNPKNGVTAADVPAFANAMRKTLRYRQDNLRDGTMLAWASRPDAVEAADRLRRLHEGQEVLIVRIVSRKGRYILAEARRINADHVQPDEVQIGLLQSPRVEVGFKRIAPRAYKFDVSETAILNAGAKIINVQWDFDYGKRFSLARLLRGNGSIEAHRVRPGRCQGLGTDTRGIPT